MLPNEKKVHVTGMGIISGIGNNVQENYKAIIDDKSGIEKIKYLNTIHEDKFPVSEVKLSNEELIELSGLELEVDYPRTTLFSCIAIKEALEQSNYKYDENIKTGLIVGTTVGGMDIAENNYRNDNQDSFFFVSTQSKSYTADLIADKYKINNYVTTLTTACSSSANAIALGADLIKANVLDRVIVGGSDSLCKFTLNGFNTLMILSKEKCRPFDNDRDGLTLGEGAGFLVLESESLVHSKGKKSLAMVNGYSNKNDAFHQTATSENGEGPFLCMKEAIEMAGIAESQIDYINAHGTGTPNNDLTESVAIKRVFGENHPPFASLKPYIGHTLGAAGSIEAIFSILSLHNQIIYRSPSISNDIEEIDIYPNKETKTKDVKYIMSNSFGFGGNDTSIILSNSPIKD